MNIDAPGGAVEPDAAESYSRPLGGRMESVPKSAGRARFVDAGEPRSIKKND
jgi:hypothetical protein